MDSGAALFLFLAVGAASLFSFIAVAVWSGARYAERETYYHSELIKKAMESPSTAGLDYLRERDREACACGPPGRPVPASGSADSWRSPQESA